MSAVTVIQHLPMPSSKPASQRMDCCRTSSSGLRLKGKFEVEAGERRRRAMLALADEKVLPAITRSRASCLRTCGSRGRDQPGGELPSPRHEPGRRSPGLCRACRRLVRLVEDVARRFGLTVRFVEGRLRLATLAPVVFEALASGEITLDLAKAFGATSDQEIQARVFEQASSGYYAPNPDSIRRMVLSGTVRGSDPRARLVGRDAYIAAGGRIERELFDDDDSESWVDVALLESARRGEDGRTAPRRSQPSRVLPGSSRRSIPMPATIWSKAWFGFQPNRRR
jgi:ParB family chromosome partitioning protein